MNKFLAYDFFKCLSEALGVDVESKLNDSEWRGTLSSFSDEKALFKVYSSYRNGNYNASIERSLKLFDDFIERGLYLRNDAEWLENGAALLMRFASLVRRCEVWRSSAKEQLFYLFRGLPLLTDADFSDEVKKGLSWTWDENARDVVFGDKYLKLYRFAGSDAMPEDGAYSIRSNIIATTDVAPYISALSKSAASDKVEVSILLKLEDIMEYSYFILCFKYGNSVWLAKDSLNFENPYMASSSRNPSRRREDHWDNVPLPYGLIDKVGELRSTAVMTVKDADAAESHVFNAVVELTVFDRIYLNLIVQSLIERFIITPNIQSIGFAGNISQLLLTNSGGDRGEPVTENGFVKTNYDKCKRVFVDDLVMPDNFLPVVPSADSALLDHVSPSALITQEEASRLSEWGLHEAIRAQKQSVLDCVFDERCREDEQLLEALFRKNIERVSALAMSGEKATYLYIADDAGQDGGTLLRIWEDANSYGFNHLCVV